MKVKQIFRKKNKSSASNSSSEHSASIGNDGLREKRNDNESDHLEAEESNEVEYVWRKIPYTGEKYVFTLLFFVSKAFR